MAVLTNGARSITVPEETVGDYLAEGWSRPGGEPAPEKKSKPKRRRASKTTKGDSDGVSVRSDSGAGAPQEGAGPV